MAISLDAAGAGAGAGAEASGDITPGRPGSRGPVEPYKPPAFWTGCLSDLDRLTMPHAVVVILTHAANEIRPAVRQARQRRGRVAHLATVSSHQLCRRIFGGPSKPYGAVPWPGGRPAPREGEVIEAIHLAHCRAGAMCRARDVTC